MWAIHPPTYGDGRSSRARNNFMATEIRQYNRYDGCICRLAADRPCTSESRGASADGKLVARMEIQNVPTEPHQDVLHAGLLVDTVADKSGPISPPQIECE